MKNFGKKMKRENFLKSVWLGGGEKKKCDGVQVFFLRTLQNAEKIGKESVCDLFYEQKCPSCFPRQQWLSFFFLFLIFLSFAFLGHFALFFGGQCWLLFFFFLFSFLGKPWIFSFSFFFPWDICFFFFFFFFWFPRAWGDSDFFFLFLFFFFFLFNWTWFFFSWHDFYFLINLSDCFFFFFFLFFLTFFFLIGHYFLTRVCE